MITFDHFMKFASARNANDRIRIGASGFLDASHFAAMVITYGSRSMKEHSVEYGTGYSPAVHDYIRDRFVLQDPYYDQVLSSARVQTWDDSDFAEGYAAERWLKPNGFRNGVSVPVVHQEFGEVGSVHLNSYAEWISDKQLSLLDQFVGFLAEEFVDRKRRNELGLSERETEIVRLIVQGATNPEIAEELYISRSTVGTHVENILRKFDTRTRVGIAVKAAKLNIA